MKRLTIIEVRLMYSDVRYEDTAPPPHNVVNDLHAQLGPKLILLCLVTEHDKDGTGAIDFGSGVPPKPGLEQVTLSLNPP